MFSSYLNNYICFKYERTQNKWKPEALGTKVECNQNGGWTIYYLCIGNRNLAS